MKGILYDSTKGLAAGILAKELRNNGIPTSRWSECLCSGKIFGDFDFIIAHPCGGNGCIEGIKRRASDNLGIDFYVLGLNENLCSSSKRAGDYENLKFVTYNGYEKNDISGEDFIDKLLQYKKQH